MNKLFFARMAAQNLRKNKRTYVPYLLTCIGAVAIYYIVHALRHDPSAGDITSQFLQIGLYVLMIFSVCFLFYTNSFLMKRRKKEFGLMSVLGLEKRHIARVIALENLYIFVLSMVLGLGLGLLLYKLVHLLLLSLMRFDIRFGFSVSLPSMEATLILFFGIFLLLLLSSLWQVGRARPIELLHGGAVGEREPKARWLMALLGLLSLGAGYWISVATEDPIRALSLFFVAVVLVIIGTYLLFTAGGIALLKLLRRNKKYYYKPNHFISVSGMIYRMKQNAAGLATICVLATMVLVMFSSTVSLYFGMEDTLDAQCVRDLHISLMPNDENGDQAAEQTLRASLEDGGLTPRDWLSYRAMSLFGRFDGDELIMDGSYRSGGDMVKLFILPLEDYNANVSAPVTLSDGKALWIPEKKADIRSTLTLCGASFQLRIPAEGFTPFDPTRSYGTVFDPVCVLVVPDMAALEALQNTMTSQQLPINSVIARHIGFDMDVGDALQIEAGQAALRALLDAEAPVYTWNSRAESRASYVRLYGGLFFLGLFLGLVFLMATVLIIYYKQISEGYDDQTRYAIMRKVGLSRREAKRSIHSQMLTMFFLPLAAAALHIVFAFPAVSRVLRVLELTNVSVFVVATVLSLLVFALFYLFVYRLTARVYTRLVEPAR